MGHGIRGIPQHFFGTGDRAQDAVVFHLLQDALAKPSGCLELRTIHPGGSNAIAHRDGNFCFLSQQRQQPIEHGTLAARPDEKACDWCDYRPVCGPFERRRTGRKPAALHADLDQLRRYP